MYIKYLRPAFRDGKVRDIGEVIEVDDHIAKHLIKSGIAEKAGENPPPAYEEAAPETTSRSARRAAAEHRE